jgi:hypothetical protein
MYKYTHIDALYQVARYIEKAPEHYKINTPVIYRGTVKLHGANMGVVCTEKKLVAQSRTQVLSLPSGDRFGFAAFMEERTAVIREIEAMVRAHDQVSKDVAVVIYGEWVGPGILGGTVVSQLPEKQWALFAVKKIEGKDDSTYLDVPYLGNQYKDKRIFSIADAGAYRLKVDFSSSESKEAALAEANQYTVEVEKCCPWTKLFFGIEGTGEGIVWVPMGEHRGNSDLCFKTKGDAHKTKAKRERPEVAPEILKSIEQFVEFSVTPNRLNQGLAAIEEMGHMIEMKSIPHFLKWIGQDVKRECEADLEASNLEWKSVSKAVMVKARGFFIEEMGGR